jgi:hypothetical protein
VPLLFAKHYVKGIAQVMLLGTLMPLKGNYSYFFLTEDRAEVL